MYQMRRYVGENVARQMDGDLVPYKDATIFAEEQTKAALAEKDDLIHVYQNTPFAHWHERALKAEEQIATLKDPCRMSEILLPMGFVVVPQDQWDCQNKQIATMTAENADLRKCIVALTACKENMEAGRDSWCDAAHASWRARDELLKGNAALTAENKRLRQIVIDCYVGWPDEVLQSVLRGKEAKDES